MSDSYVAPPPPAPQPAPESSPQPYPQPAPAKQGNGLAVAGFVLGLLGFLGSFIPVLNIGGIVLGVVGAILAAVGLAKASKVGAGKGLALTGLILGSLALVIGIVVNVAFANAVDDAVDDVTDTSVVAPDNTASDPADDPADDDSAAGEIGASRDNPAPLGSAITGGDWTVTINSVTPVDADSLGQAAAAGSALLQINLTATYNGTDAQGSTSWANVGFVTADGVTIDGLSGSTYFLPETQFDSMTTLYEGGSVSGDQIIEVPADNWQAGVLVVTADLLSDDTFVAVQ